MNKKTLILLCDNYLSSGGSFIDDEMQVIADKFEKIIVITNNNEKLNLPRYISDNMKIETFQDKITRLDKLKIISYLIKPFIIRETIFIIKKYKINIWIACIKIMLMDLIKAIKLKSQILEFTKKNNLDYSNAIFYSYWHDYKSLALALLKRENRNNICVSRAHGWDVFSYRHNPPYLPFKKFIISSINQTFSVSNAGKLEFQKLLNNNLSDKVSISKLGKINNRIAIVEKQSNCYMFCSCSNLIPVKRVHLIVDILSKLPFQNIKWVHFGDGYLRNKLEQLAKEKLKNIAFCFKGIVPNSEILDFYNQNYIDLFINVSESEGIPVSIMEALSAGIPVLATNVGGTSEIVNNEVGFLLEKDFEINAVIKIIEDYLNSSVENQKTYRKMAYEFWEKNYNAEVNYKKFADDILKL